MKNTFISLIVTVMTLAMTCITVEAQPNMHNWKERMQSEKIAFLTMEIGLTPEEAQNFWPVYNSVSEELDKATYSTIISYMELEKALNDKKSDKEINKCLENYLNAMETQNKIRNESVAKYKKILSERKVAKIFVAEEKFRRENIRKLQRNPIRP